MSYYDWTTGMALRDVIRRWQENGEKMYDRSMPVMVPLSDLWPHREYTWKRGSARRSPEEWDDLAASMKRGWQKREPLHFSIGRKGGAKVGEGNHRLAIARQLGIKQIPVEFHFQSGKVEKTRIPRRPLKTVRRKPKPRPTDRTKPSPGSEKHIDDILKLLGG